MERDLLSIDDLSPGELGQLLELSAKVKAQPGDYADRLAGRSVAMIFEKPSTRTRMSFEAGMHQLGGAAIYLYTRDSQLGRGEPVEDAAQVISRMCDIIMVRTFEQDIINRFAANSRVPVINGLTNEYHPCQILADVYTFIEHRGAIKGKTKVYPEYTASMTHATYMASMWVSWMNMGIPLAIGNAVVGSSNRALLGPAPNFTLSAEVLTRQAIKPLYEPGSRRLGVNVARNPVRRPRFRNAGTYRALSVAATKSPGRELRILVVNRLPNDRVAARVDLRRFTSRGFALVSTVNGASFRSWNTPGATEVRLKTDRRGIGRDGFRGVFPAHSVTVIRVPAR